MSRTIIKFYRFRCFSRYLLRVATDRRFTGNRFSRVLRRVFEQRLSRRFLGINLMAATLFVGTAMPTGNLNLFDDFTNPSLNARITQLTTQKTVILPLPAFEISQNYTLFHRGLDLRAPLNTEVKPIMEGVVKQTKNNSDGYGRHIIIDHGNGFESLYAHLKRIDVQTGDSVNHQTALGLSGSTGLSSGPHLHLEVRENGRPFDPLILLK
ncbi:MAG: M23 family metallopeptidase [Candidatus Shapirobacteria bacterium]